MAEVHLTRGLLALVDDADLPIIAAFKWWANRDHRTHYARASIYLGRFNGKCRFRRLVMHRLILDAPAGTQVDHINGDGLDNRRANLRLAGAHENAWNQRAPLNNSSGFKGVTFARREGRFQASLELDGKAIWCGYHATAEAAARAYDAAALKHFGEFARLNFPTKEAA